jgi:hypothetical protein
MSSEKNYDKSYVHAPCDVASDAPRNTFWFTINLPLYSPIAPGALIKPGIGQVGTFGPLPGFAPGKLRRGGFPLKFCR